MTAVTVRANREEDLEGMVSKRENSPYCVTEKPSQDWFKAKNPRYSQLEGREALLECGQSKPL